MINQSMIQSNPFLSLRTGASRMRKMIMESKRVSNVGTIAATERAIHSTSASIQELLEALRQLDTSSLCDAEKSIGINENGIRLMNPTIRPMNHNRRPNRSGSNTVMAGVARTVSFTEPNDFLPVMRALSLEAERDEVLVVDTKSSTRAVAGEIFVAEARRKGLAGIVIDGPIRDTAHLEIDSSLKESSLKDSVMRMYATGITPYSGTTQSPGEMQAPAVSCGGIEVRPGDIVVGDNDGVLVGDVELFSRLVSTAQKIQTIEHDLIEGIATGNRTLASMTNLDDHVRRRINGEPSSLQFHV